MCKLRVPISTQHQHDRIFYLLYCTVCTVVLYQNGNGDGNGNGNDARNSDGSGDGNGDRFSNPEFEFR